MITTLADQYLAQNAGRRYPLADDAGYDGIKDDTAILDFRCTVRGIPAGTAPRAWITAVADATVNHKAHTRITVTVDRPGTPDVLAFDIPNNIAENENAPYTASAADSGTGAEGTLTVSASAILLARGVKSVPLAWTTVVCDSLKVNSIQSVQAEADAHDADYDPPDRSATERLSGKIALAEGRNTEPYLDGNRLRLDVFKGGGLGERCQSAVTGDQTCGKVLFTINGERPGSSGEIRIVGDSGVTVTPDPENHAVEIRMDDTAAGRAAIGCAPACSEG